MTLQKVFYKALAGSVIIHVLWCVVQEQTLECVSCICLKRNQGESIHGFSVFVMKVYYYPLHLLHVLMRLCMPGYRINSLLLPVVIHLQPCHFSFKSCPSLGNVPPVRRLAQSELLWHLRALHMLFFELGRVLLPDFSPSHTDTRTHIHYHQMRGESYCGGMLRPDHQRQDT